jgi:biopolymer transport protein ExbD
MKRVREQGNAISGINITPIIDITLVLLIIMLVAAPMLNIPNMDVQLPEAYTSETKQQNVSVSLGTDLRIAIDEDIVPLDKMPRLLDRVLKKKPGSMVIIRADKDVDYESVENLIETIKTKTRAEKIAVATKQKTIIPGEK